MERLAGATRCTRIAAWGRGPDGAPQVLAARIEGAALTEPPPGALEAATRLAGAWDLGASDTPPPLQALADQGFSAVAPIRTAEHEGAVGLLLLGGPAEPLGRVRPRTLAALGAAAERLRGPFLAAASAARLARLDLEVQRLDRLAALGGLVAEIVHEIRNPLVSVKTFLQLLPERESDPEFTESFLAVAREELQRIERLLGVVLQHGRPPRADRAPARGDLAEALESVTQLVRFRADDQELTLEAELPGRLPPVTLGPDALRQVLLNLALNAIEASPRSGTVRVTAARSGGRLRIRVEDEGDGIPPALRPHLFTPFFSTKTERPGGLGLAITARILEEAGGGIRAADRPGGGTRMEVTLPLAPRR